MNRLADSQSLYLLQHASNPVDWWPWGEEAMTEAERRDVPILLSVGYAACHWCHVMAHESFEDQETATKINSDFVAIKVDREERPDVDAVYMQATQAMTGQGGWPMTVFLTPNGDPFHAGTYFPKTAMHGLPSFRQVLDAVSAAWAEHRDDIRTGAADISQRLSASSFREIGGTLTEDDLASAVRSLAADYDERHAGFGGAPKFPPSMVIEALLRVAESPLDDQLRGSARTMALDTLLAMASGGIHDQLAGGFARYSVDSGWVVPHFEKMLYDNGLLLSAYLHGWRITEHPRLRQVVSQTVDWLLSEMITEQGAFAASLDADSPDATGTLTEGAYYLWDQDQLRAVLADQDAIDFVVEHGRVTAEGTAEHGRSTLQLHGVDPADDVWAAIRSRLADARSRRARPARDDKIIAGWNGLVIDALAEAGALLDEPNWIDAARDCATTIWQLHWVDGRLRRASRAGVVGSAPGTAEDYGLLALSFIRLAEVTGESSWIERAGELIGVLDEHFGAPDGGWFDTADDAESLINRPKDPTDNASPSGLSAALHAVTRYATYTGSTDAAVRAERAARSVGRLVTAAPRFAGWLLADAVSRVAGSIVEIAVVGDPEDPSSRALASLARRLAPAGSVVVVGLPDAAGVPLLADRSLIDGRPAAYVCRTFVCRMPVTTEDALRAELKQPRR
jgi:uncharacterized protein YyaL (SSP411 family)